eukprot:scaffold364352_cov23-Prasinocladus_malaysianus.AAC.1
MSHLTPFFITCDIESLVPCANLWTRPLKHEKYRRNVRMQQGLHASNNDRSGMNLSDVIKHARLIRFGAHRAV